MRRSLYLDFEFSGIVEPVVQLVCCATYDPITKEKIKWWLYGDKPEQERLAKYLSKYDIVMGYSCVAEARSFLALGLLPLEFEWLDLFLEYRMMTNHNDALQWGDQLVDGKVKKTTKPRPKWELEEGEKASGFRATHSLAEATYKLTGEIRDTAHKTKMRELIISAPESFTKKEQEDILEYCMQDVIFLPKIWKRIKEEYEALVRDPDMQQYFKEALLRGRYSAHTANMEARGYPIDIEKTRNFSRQVGNIVYDLQREINKLFPEIKPFRWNKKEQRFSWDQKITKAWVADNHDVSKWMRTDKGDISLALEAFEKFYSFQHSYPEDNFGAQMVRFLKLKQSIYGFNKTKGKGKNFWDSVGSDGRVRPYMNHYGAQSSRSQPASSGFMFLKPAWMRALVSPAKGYFMASIDYGQQEFFISAIESESSNMIQAYLSGDPYLHTAKLAGAVPMDGKREDYKAIRDLFKGTTLAISFAMTKYGLAIKLTNDTGREWTEDEAQEQIDMFYDAYPELLEYQESIKESYIDGCAIKLPCGWTVWPDNENLRSVTNCPIQGHGSSVMRKAVDLAESRGVKILFTLHDALYMEDKIGQEHKIKILADCMREAFIFYADKKYKKVAGEIKLDPFAWSPNYKKDSEIYLGKEKWEVPISNLYIDSRSESEYNKFSKYFIGTDFDNL
jgi:DNA polymerase-1